MVFCKITDCKRAAKTKGLCEMHYMQSWRAASEPLTPDRLRALVFYDLRTGVFLWRENGGISRVGGARAGYIDNRGYRSIVIKGKVYKEHRLAFLYTFGRWPAQEIDHRNRIRDQNNFANLREATPAQNAANANAHKGTQSGVRGVYRHRSKWRAKIRANNLIYRLGTFATIEEAKAARDEAAVRLCGVFAH